MQINPEQQKFPAWKPAAMAVLGGLLLAPLLARMPLPGWDWYWVFWENRDTLTWYLPWTALLISPIAYLPWRLGLSLVNGFTLAALGIVTFRERPGLWAYVAVAMATLSVPAMALIWDGQIDGLGLLGYLILPWGTPLLLIKPTLSVWVLLARKRWAIAGIAFFALSVLLWGWWPDQVIRLHVLSDYIDPLHGPHPSSMGWFKLGWPIALVGVGLMFFTNRKDPMHLMAAGSFLMPYVFPYHFIFLIPVLGRFSHVRQLTLWLLSWTLLLPFAFESQGALIAYIFPLAAWYLLWREAPVEDTWLAAFREASHKLQNWWEHRVSNRKKA